MQSIRVEMRRGHGAELSIPQFRTLGFIRRNPNTSLSELADHLGLTPPSVSKLVDGLVKQDLIIRREDGSDRRRLTLALTQSGKSHINSARAGAQANLARTLSCLSKNELKTIHQALEFLHPLFAPNNKEQFIKE